MPGPDEFTERRSVPRRHRFSRRWLPWILFALTCASTFFVGCLSDARFPAGHPEPTLLDAVRFGWLGGFQYAAAVMTILVFHEMGHFLTARLQHLPASPPYFLPMPIPPFGTMGAVIFQGSYEIDGEIVVAADRKQMFDVAIAGPLAGLVIALPVTVYGVMQSAYGPLLPGTAAFGDPVVLTWIAEIVHGPAPPGHELYLNPWLFAGWVGLFLTALNLMPIGQLDGGHILYALIGRKAHFVSVLIAGAAGLWVIGYLATWALVSLGALSLLPLKLFLARGPVVYGLMLLLLALTGLRHPATLDDRVPLGKFRILAGWITLAFVIIGFTPAPIRVFGS